MGNLSQSSSSINGGMTLPATIQAIAKAQIVTNPAMYATAHLILVAVDIEISVMPRPNVHPTMTSLQIR